MQSYLQKHSFFETLVNEAPCSDLMGIIIIPSYHEVDLMNAIQSLIDCIPPNGIVEILPILNHHESDDASVIEFHWKQYEEILKRSNELSSGFIKLHAIKPFVLPNKIAGVGLARKIGMDEAVRRFESISRNGIILNFDADCICASDYLVQVFGFFKSNDIRQAVSIGFRHRWDPLKEEQKQAIILYELHLRCYIGWQKWHGYPFAYQTLGSCFAVTSKAYQAQGGMNKRKAGEDFYFLNKFSIHGALGELNKPLVFPSGRISHRVPFGTGRGVHDIIHSSKPFKTYNPNAIRSFCQFLDRVSHSYQSIKQGDSFEQQAPSNSLLEFLHNNAFAEAIQLTVRNCATAETFHKRISRWFDPFRLMKYLHFARESEFKDFDVLDSAQGLYRVHHPDQNDIHDNLELLLNELTAFAYEKN